MAKKQSSKKITEAGFKKALSWISVVGVIACIIIFLLGGWWSLIALILLPFVLLVILVLWAIYYVYPLLTYRYHEKKNKLFVYGSLGIAITGLLLLLWFALIGGPNKGMGMHVFGDSNPYLDAQIGVVLIVFGLSFLSYFRYKFIKSTVHSVTKKTVKQAQPTAKNKSRPAALWNKHWQVILILVLVFGILGFIGVNKLIIYNQKQQFDQAEKSLDTLYANIVKDVGQPTSMTKDKSCSYASTEGGSGDRRCQISLALYYQNQEDEATANLTANNIDDTISKIKNSILVDNSLLGNLRFSASSDYFSRESNEVDAKGGLICSVGYYYGTDLSRTILRNQYFKIPTGTNFITLISCYNDSLAEFYPVKN